MRLPFSSKVALRLLAESRGQTALIMLGTAVGVGVLVFLSALIDGLQASLIDQTLSTQAHVIVEPLDDAARPLLDREDQAVAAQIQSPPQRLRSIASWPAVLRRVASTPGVTHATPTVTGPGLAIRGAASRSVVVRGIEPASYLQVSRLGDAMVAGAVRVGGASVVLGADLARALGAQVGDRVRISTAGAPEQAFLVTGLFDLGNRGVNEQWVFVSLPSAQSLLGLEGGVSAIEATVNEIFEADAVAVRVSEETGLSAESWMSRNEQLLVALRSQSSSSTLIQVFVIISVALGIASVLGVSVVQKSREIGILKAMGAGTGQVLRVFVIQGLLVGLFGSVAGGALGAGLAFLFQGLAVGPGGDPLFPVAVEPALFARAAAVALATGLAAGIAPARRAAGLDPATVLRNV